MKRIIIIYLLFIVSVGIFAETNAYNNITPGAVWNSTNGAAINAHGGCVIYNNGYYYWFGEDRTQFVSNGVSCYKSTDLLNWSRIGIVFAHSGTASTDMNDFSAGRLMERPKVIYNDSTHKWVMFGHWEINENDYSAARVCVATSDNIDGPYTFYKTYRPNTIHDSRDQTIFKDTDGKVYHMGTTDMNYSMILSLMTNDYLDPTPTETKVLIGKRYEAPAIFKLGDIYFGLFSNCTGWDPNPGQTAFTTNIMGDWSDASNFCVDNLKEVSYNSQSAYVFKVNGFESAYIYIGDRWNSSNAEASTYVWEPLSMRSGYPTVRSYSSWNLSVFNEFDRYKRAKTIETGNIYSLLEKTSNRLVSKLGNGSDITGLAIMNDSTTNMNFSIIQTATPYVYKIQDTKTGNFMESIFGSLRLNPESSASSQNWYFSLKQDGYYNIMNMNDRKCLTISGSSTFNVSNIYLDKLTTGLHQDFAVYFDSENQNYEAADLFSVSYIADNLDIIADQNKQTAIPIVKDNVGSEFNIFPVVNNGNFNIKLNNIANSGTVEIQIIEVGSGKLVYSKSITFDNSILSVNQSGALLNGMYLVRIKSNESSVVRKMIVQ